MEKLNMFNYFLITISVIGLVFYLRPFVRYVYIRYFDKTPFEINIDGKNYLIDPKSSKFMIEQMEEQDAAREKKDSKNE